MKIWYPITFEDSGMDDLSSYITACAFDLLLLQSILRNNINLTRWNTLTEKLPKCKHILIQNTHYFKATKIPTQYISYLRCNYDNAAGQCYYSVPDNVRCIGTATPLNKVVKLIEYGNDLIPPFGWIRHSYVAFKTRVMGDVKNESGT